MAVSKRQSSSDNPGSGRPNGPQALIIAAEKLFARYGIDEVSLREIVRAAGQSNNYAVQHHFQDKEGLIRAILDLRLPQLNEMRLRRLEKLKKSDQLDVRSLLEALYMPMADLTDEAGRHVYVQFLLRTHWRDYSAIWTRDAGKIPAVHEIRDALRAHFPDMDDRTFALRQELVSVLFFNAVVLIDQKAEAGMSDTAQRRYLAQTLLMCAAAMQAPLC